MQRLVPRIGLDIRPWEAAGGHARFLYGITQGRPGRRRRWLAMPSVQSFHRTAQPNSIRTMTTEFPVAQDGRASSLGGCQAKHARPGGCSLGTIITSSCCHPYHGSFPRATGGRRPGHRCQRQRRDERRGSVVSIGLSPLQGWLGWLGGRSWGIGSEMEYTHSL